MGSQCPVHHHKGNAAANEQQGGRERVMVLGPFRDQHQGHGGQQGATTKGDDRMADFLFQPAPCDVLFDTDQGTGGHAQACGQAEQ